MAEAKHGSSKNFGRVLQKTVSRTKEKVLQNLGKADKTQDEEFDTDVSNFAKQQMVALKLQKELKNYLQCVKAMSAASKVFYETVRESYEDTWTGHSDVTGAVEALAAMWDDYVQKLSQQVQDPLASYVAKFPEVKHKIAKRNRKLMDYDGTRHTRDALINQKKKDEAKINKAHDEMNAAKKIYQDINSELHEELPSFYESRKSVLSSALNSLFSSEAKFQEESAKIKYTLADATERLNRESSDVFFRQYNHSPHTSDNRASLGSTPRSGDKLKHIPSDTASSGGTSSHSQQNDTNHLMPTPSDTTKLEYLDKKDYAELTITNGEAGINLTGTSPAAATTTDDGNAYENIMIDSQTTQNTTVDDEENTKASTATPPSTAKLQEATNNNQMKADNNDSGDEITPASDNPVYVLAEKVDADNTTENVYSVPTKNLPVTKDTKDTVLYQVEATHPYTGEDTDELTFEMGDRINVIPYEDPEEQDDGWLMGVKVSDGQMGVFPENFTKRV